MLPTHLEQAFAYHFPFIGCTLYSHRLCGCLGQPRPSHRQGRQPCSNPQLLQPSLLDGIDNNGPFCSSGTVLPIVYFAGELRLMYFLSCVLQFIVGFFSFLLLLCCESATASFRAALVPIHSTFGITTFVMAVATACTGLTEKAFFTLRYVQDLLPNPDRKILAFSSLFLRRLGKAWRFCMKHICFCFHNIVFTHKKVKS